MATVIEGIKFYTIPETAQALRVTPQTIRSWIKQGKLKSQRIGRPILITERNLKEFLKENRQSTTINITLQKQKMNKGKTEKPTEVEANIWDVPPMEWNSPEMDWSIETFWDEPEMDWDIKNIWDEKE